MTDIYFLHTYLSNFYLLDEDDEIALPISGYMCKSSEHAYQALKYEYEDAPPQNELLVEEIVKASTPYKAKVLGHGTNQYTKWKWQRELVDIAKNIGAIPIDNLDEAKVDIMRRVLALKFTPTNSLGKKLVKTYPSRLYEDSPYDMFWGCRGKNMLGILLEERRQQLMTN